jgi:hypothetical protein
MGLTLLAACAVLLLRARSWARDDGDGRDDEERPAALAGR